ncbi:MAG: RusA family crossover junction endodeoxyribonuclease [Chloroflexi bacterium]|nr:RusA family crossover junction endodeoxyribonuclease [Chloroflexota bacterium]
MAESATRRIVIIRGVARSKYAKSAPKYELTVKGAAQDKFTKPLTEKNLAVAVRHFYTSGHRIDLDNLLKSVLDGLKGAAYEDDSQIVRVSAERYNIAESYVVEQPTPEELDLLAERRDFVVVTVDHV